MTGASAGHYSIVRATEHPRASTGRGRHGLVLGAGGILGGFWSLGALRALEEVTSWDIGQVDVIMGTSAGALLSSLLAAGIRVADLVERPFPVAQAPTGASMAPPLDRVTSLTMRPRLLPPGSGSPELLVRSLLNPFRPSLLAWCTALVPEGGGSLGGVRDLVDAVSSDGEWPTALRVVATDYATGRRRSFCSWDRFQVTVADAVTASCAMPACFSPIDIGGRRYVDGAVASVTNADLLADSELDSVAVLAPMAAADFDRPGSPPGWLERAARTCFNRALVRERRVLERAGTVVRVFAPNAEDLSAMGANLMDPTRGAEVLATARATVTTRLGTG